MATKETMLYRVCYSEKDDAYYTYFYIGDNKYPDFSEYLWEAKFKCMPAWISEDGRATEGSDFVSFQLISYIRQAVRLGFKIEFADLPE